MGQVDGETPYFFISFSAKDQKFAIDLCEELERRNVSCLIAPRDMEVSAGYAETLVRNIQCCTAFLLLATDAAMASEDVRNELQQAHKFQRPIYTIMISKGPVPAAVDYYIARLHWLQHTTTQDPAATLAQTLANIVHGKSRWHLIARPPSLRRRIAYFGRKTFWSLITSLLTVLIFASAFLLWQHKQEAKLASDYRSLGWVTFSSSSVPDKSNQLPMQLQFWHANDHIPLNDISLYLVTQDASQAVHKIDLSEQLHHVSGVDVHLLPLSIPSTVKSITACIVMAPKQDHPEWVISQTYVRTEETPDSIGFSPVADPTVNPSKTSICQTAR